MENSSAPARGNSTGKGKCAKTFVPPEGHPAPFFAGLVLSTVGCIFTYSSAPCLEAVLGPWLGRGTVPMLLRCRQECCSMMNIACRQAGRSAGRQVSRSASRQVGRSAGRKFLWVVVFGWCQVIPLKVWMNKLTEVTITATSPVARTVTVVHGVTIF